MGGQTPRGGVSLWQLLVKHASKDEFLLVNGMTEPGREVGRDGSVKPQRMSPTAGRKKKQLLVRVRTPCQGRLTFSTVNIGLWHKQQAEGTLEVCKQADSELR